MYIALQPIGHDHVGSLPEFGQCPWHVTQRPILETLIYLICSRFSSAPRPQVWQRDCEYKLRSSISLQRVGHAGRTDKHPD